MQLIQTSEALASAAASSDDTDLANLLGTYAVALEEFDEELSATVLIIENGDRLAEIEAGYGARLVADGRFTFIAERIARYGKWIDVLWITSDDGSGLVLLIEDLPNTDAQLLTACHHALRSEPTD